MRTHFSFTNALSKLGLSRNKKRRTGANRRKSRNPMLEPLEERQLLATDLGLTSFQADGTNLLVGYDVDDTNGGPVDPFNISIYRSSDGATLDSLLVTHQVTDPADLQVGTGHQAVIAADFVDDKSDYQLVAVIDSSDAIAEDDETNNQLPFEGGVFFAADGTIHVHGLSTADAIDVTQPGEIKVDFNGTLYDYTASTVSEVHLRTHGGDDDARVQSGVLVPLWAFGGAGDDVLYGGQKDDDIHGGAGDDVLKGRQGDDTITGEDGDDQLIGDMGNDTLLGGLGDDHLQGNENDDTLDGGKGFDTIDGVIDVNTAPTASGVVEVSVDEDSAPLVVDLTAAFEDAEHLDSELTFAVTIDRNPWLVTSADVDSAAGTLTLSFRGDHFGSASLTVLATDPLGLSVTTPLAVNVASVNDVPTTTGLAPITFYSGASGTTVDLAAAFSDVEDSPTDLTYSITANTNPVMFTSLNIDPATGQLALDFAHLPMGVADLTIRATDNDRAYVATVLRAELLWTGPEATGIADMTVAEDGPTVTVDLFAAFEDSDDPDETLLYEIVGNTRPDVVATAIDATAGELALALLPDAYGTVTVTVRATDPDGDLAENSFVLDVQDVDDAPVINGLLDSPDPAIGGAGLRLKAVDTAGMHAAPPLARSPATRLAAEPYGTALR